MYSNTVPFTEIIDAVKDGTGITNLRNLYPKIRRLIYRIEGEIGFGGTLLLKRVTYSVANGGILNHTRVRLPEDFVALESFGMCREGICPNNYKIQGNWLFFSKKVESFSLIYYCLLCDGEGNPMVSQTHKEAVISGLLYFLYQPRMWNHEGNLNMYKELQNYYDDRIGESRGNDVFPSSDKEWSQISQLMQMSRKDTVIYNSKEKCYLGIPEYTIHESEVIDEPQDDSSGTGNNNYLTQQEMASLPIYDSIQEATFDLGINKLFVYSNKNIHGVVSPINSVIGITRKLI